MKNNKTVNDTFTSRAIAESAMHQSQMKDVMITKTPGRYAVKAMMSGFLLAIVTVFMLAIKTQFAGTPVGLINILGAISFSLALVLIVLTNSELLTSNFMFVTVGYYYRAITMRKIMYIVFYCFLFNIVGGLILFGLMRFTHVMTPEMITALTKTVSTKTVESTWYAILVKGIFCNFFIILVSMYQCYLKMAYLKLSLLPVASSSSYLWATNTLSLTQVYMQACCSITLMAPTGYMY